MKPSVDQYIITHKINDNNQHVCTIVTKN